MFRRKTTNKGKKVSHFSILNVVNITVICSLLLIMQSCNFMISTIQQDYTISKKELQESQWRIIETIISETNIKAQEAANSSAERIEQELLSVYNDSMQELKYDMYNNNSSENKFLRVLKNNLQTVDGFKSFTGYMSGIVTNSDSYFSVDPDKGLERTWEEEIATHHNKQLARESINSFTLRKERLKDKIRFWEKEPHSNSNHKLITEMSLNAMKEVYLSEGLDGLKNYTFFAVSYITSSGDIFGVPDIDIQGSENDNNKIFIAHTYNIYDIIMKSYKGDLEKIDKSIYIINQSVEKQIKIIKFVSYVLVLTMIIILCIVTIFIKKKILEIKNSYLNIKK